MAIKIVARLTEMPPSRLSAAKRSACSRHSRDVNGSGLPFLLGQGLRHRCLNAPELTGKMKPSLSGSYEAPSMSVVVFRLRQLCFGLCPTFGRSEHSNSP
jgi:hypothetical protein